MNGYFKNTINIGTNILNNTGISDIFIAKYDSSGNSIWAKGEGGNNYDYGKSISTDSQGNLVMTGSFKSPTITFGTTVLTNTGINDIFIVKYDTSGNVLWAKGVGGSAAVQSVCTGVSGNVFMTGFFNSPSITFGTTTLYNVGIINIFI